MQVSELVAGDIASVNFRLFGPGVLMKLFIVLDSELGDVVNGLLVYAGDKKCLFFEDKSVGMLCSVGHPLT